MSKQDREDRKRFTIGKQAQVRHLSRVLAERRAKRREEQIAADESAKAAAKCNAMRASWWGNLGEENTCDHHFVPANVTDLTLTMRWIVNTPGWRGKKIMQCSKCQANVAL